MRIGITGSTGYIGSKLVEHFLSEGHYVRAFSRSKADFTFSNACNLDLVIVNYNSLDCLVHNFQGLDVVVHLCGLAHNYSALNKSLVSDYYESNVHTVRQVALASGSASLSRLIYISSLSVYGKAESPTCLDDSTPASPNDIYGLTKLMGELELSNLLADRVTDWVVLRPPMVYGIGCPGNLDRLLLLTKYFPFLPFKGFRESRSFISLNNIMTAISACLENSSLSNQSFVVCDRFPISTFSIVSSFLTGFGLSQFRLFYLPSSLIALMARAFGNYTNYVRLSSRLHVDSTRFQKLSGWSPDYSYPEETMVKLARFNRSTL